MAPACPFSAALSGTADGGFATPFSFLIFRLAVSLVGRHLGERGCGEDAGVGFPPSFYGAVLRNLPLPRCRPPLIYTRTLYSRRPARFQGSFLGQQQYIEAAKAAFKRRYGPMIEIIRRAPARAKSRP